MLSFVVVSARRGRTIPPSVRTFCAATAPASLAFAPAANELWESKDSRHLFAGWQIETPGFGIGSHWHIDERGVTAFSGHVWPSEGGWSSDRSWAAQLAERLSRSSLRRSIEAFRGVFCAASISAAGAGCVSADALGCGILYTAETTEVTIVSTRAALAADVLAAAGRPVRRDPLGVGWLAYTGHNIIGNATGFIGVRTAPPNTCLVLGADGAQPEQSCSPPWTGEAPARSELDAIVDRVEADLLSTVDIAATLPADSHLLDLTGGKDSRLVLAALVRAGVTEQFVAQTFGLNGSADARVAHILADRAAIAHEMAVMDDDDLDFADQVLRHTVTTSGMLSAWDMRSYPAIEPTVRLSGVGGEMLRTNYPLVGVDTDEGPFESVVERRLAFDSSSLLRPEVRDVYRTELAAALDVAHPGASRHDRVDVFYLRTRLRRWFGTGEEVDRTNRVFPLYTVAGLRAAFALGSEERRLERLHYELIRRWAPDLVNIAFADDAWHGALGVASDPVPTDPVPIAGPDPDPALVHAVRAGWQRRRDERIDVLRRFLVDDSQHPVFELLDRTATVAAVERFHELSRAARAQLHGALTAAVWLDASAIEGH